MTDQDQAPIKQFTTSCGSCIFAEWEDGKQSGCEVGRLEKFSLAHRARPSEDFTHYEIQGICNTCRGEEWKLANQGLPLVPTVEREVQVGVDILLYSVDEEPDTVIQRVERAISSCAKQIKIKPKTVVVVVRNKEIKFRELYANIGDILAEYDIPFQLVQVMEEDANIDRCVEMGFEKCKSQFTAVFDLGMLIPSNLIYNLNDLINYELSRIVMIQPIVDYSGMVLATNLFKLLGKNYNFPIYEKVQEVADEQDNQHLITTWDEICGHK